MRLSSGRRGRRIGTPKQTLYASVQTTKKTVRATGTAAALSDSVEIRRLKAELRRVAEERDVLKSPPHPLPRGKGEVL